MSFPTTLRRPIRCPTPITSCRSPKQLKTQLSTTINFSSNFLKCKGFRSHISCITDFSCKIGSNKRPICVRASSNDARSISSSGGPFRDGGEFQEPSALEFITSERVKVVMMLALALALCNADRVVMSVAIVPLSLSNGWRQSFAGVVQVISFFDYRSDQIVLLYCIIVAELAH